MFRLSLLFASAYACAAGLVPCHTSAQDVVPERWSLSSVPAVSVDSSVDLSSAEWGSVVGLRRLTSGRIAVVDGLKHEVSVYSPDGRHIRTSGRTGDGPGEFRIVMPPLECSRDSIFVWDPASSRVTVFDEDGEYARDFNQANVFVKVPATLPLRPADLQCTTAGVFVAKARIMNIMPQGIGPIRVNVQVGIVTEPGGKGVTIGPFPGDARYFSGSSLGPQPLGTRTVMAAGSDRVYVGTGDSYDIEIFSFDGMKKGAVRDDVERVPLTGDLLEEFVESRPDASRRFLTSLEYPKLLPAYSDLRVDSEENLWVRQYPVPGTAHDIWRVYGQRGVLLATVGVPDGFRVFDIDADYVLGTIRDEFDVDHVRVYRLLRPDSPDF